MSSSPFVAPENQEAQYGYDSLQEEIEEQYGSRAAQRVKTFLMSVYVVKLKNGLVMK